MARVIGIILAAGKSSRLGQPKQLLDLAGEPLLRHTVRNALNSKLDQVVLVLGARAAEIDAEVGYLGQRIVVNPLYDAGQSTSMRLGLESIEPDADAVLFLLGDQPSVNPGIINALLDQFEHLNAPIVQARYANGSGNPVLFARALFPELMAIEGDEGARSVITRHRSEMVFAEFQDRPIPQDVDTLDDYQALLASWATDPTKSDRQ
jgi:molybdenum cofactor cytidylyltransferase